MPEKKEGSRKHGKRSRKESGRGEKTCHSHKKHRNKERHHRRGSSKDEHPESSLTIMSPESLARAQNSALTPSEQAAQQHGFVGPMPPQATPTVFGPQRPPGLAPYAMGEEGGRGEEGDHTEIWRDQEQDVDVEVLAGGNRQAGEGSGDQSEEDDDDMIGPRIPDAVDQDVEGDLVQKVHDVERRSQAMRRHLTDNAVPQGMQREEWMVVPPTVRKFGAGEEDRSIWTDTPEIVAARKQSRLQQEEEKPVPPPRPRSIPAQEARDKAIAEAVEQYNAVHRGTALIHQHKEKGKKKKKEKTERQPFDRERDLKITPIESGQREHMLAEAARLDSRFSHGASRFL